MVSYYWVDKTSAADMQEGAKFYSLVGNKDGKEFTISNIIYKKIWGSYLVVEGYKRFKTLTDAKIYAESTWGIKLTKKKTAKKKDDWHPFGL